MSWIQAEKLPHARPWGTGSCHQGLALPREQWGVDGLHGEFGDHSGYPQLLGTPSLAYTLYSITPGQALTLLGAVVPQSWGKQG